MSGVSQIIGVCIVRNGERCKDCIYYGKPCAAFKKKHKNKKPKDIDYSKSIAMKEWYKNG